MRGVRSITFTLSRVTAELILRHARRLLESKRLDDKVMAYRAGYLPEQRRAIERRLFDGDLLAVTSTTALELGVDIGGLDAVIMVGYPGSIAGFRQQMGRAGREGKTALAILIGLSGGLHQYLMQHPQFLLQADAEQAALDPRNEFILGAHLLCAAYELPIAQADSDLFGPATGELLEILAEEGFLSLRQGMWYWTQPDIYPAGQISIRSVAGKHYDIVDLMQDTLLGTVDADAAFRTVYPGAIYLHGGETYRVEQLDLEQRRADVVAAEVDYYTVPMSVSQVHVRETTEQFQAGDLTVRYGPVDISTRVIGYRKIRTRDHRELGVEELALPTREFDTYGLWLSSLEAMRVCADGGHDLLGSLHALEHILIGLLPLFAMCDPRDAGGASEVAHPDTGAPTVFIYDAYPGGVRLPHIARPRADAAPGASALVVGGLVRAPMSGGGLQGRRLPPPNLPPTLCPLRWRFRAGPGIGAELRGADSRGWPPDPALPPPSRPPAGGPAWPPHGGRHIDYSIPIAELQRDIPRRQYFAGRPILRIRRWRGNRQSAPGISIRCDARRPGAPESPASLPGGGVPPRI